MSGGLSLDTKNFDAQYAVRKRWEDCVCPKAKGVDKGGAQFPQLNIASHG